MSEEEEENNLPVLRVPAVVLSQRVFATRGVLLVIASYCWLSLSPRPRAIEIAANREQRPIQNGMDGTRIIRSVELYLDKYLVGKAFTPDVRMHPDESGLPTVESRQQLPDYVLEVRSTGQGRRKMKSSRGATRSKGGYRIYERGGGGGGGGHHILNAAGGSA